MFGLRKKLFVLLPMAPRIVPGPPVESSMHYSCGHTIRDTDCNSTEAREPCKICLREEIRENCTEKSGKHVSEVFLDYIAGKKRFMFVLLHLKEFLLYVHEVFSCSSHQSLNLKNIISRTTKHS